MADFTDGMHCVCLCRPRLGRQRDSGAPGFGNAREVRNLLELAISRQSARVIKERQQGRAAG